MKPFLSLAPLSLSFFLAACGDSSAVTESSATSGAGGSGGATSGGATSGATTTAAQGTGGGAAACPPDALVPGTQQFEITFGGNPRQYELQVPLSYDNTAPVPLVFDFHGYTSNKDQQELVSGISGIAEEEGFVVVRANGIGSSWNAGDFCCGQAQADGLDDVGLAKAIVTEVSSRVCINPKRVYSTGISNGGALSHRIACEAADVFAAVAPVSYPLDFDPFTKCQPSRPIAVLHLHGKSDLIVPYNGTGAMPATPESFGYWAEVNGCTGDPTVTYQQDDSLCEVYETCDAGVQVGLCSIDGGHILYTNNDNVPVGQLAWQFLSQHTLP